MKLQLPWVSDAEWNARADLNRPDAEAIADPVWRIANLYYIRTDDGRKVQFEPTPEQRILIFDLVVRGYKALIIPKARRLGVSTVLCLIAADRLVFEAGEEIALVDKTKEDAEAKLQRIVRFAIDSLPEGLRKVINFTTDNQSEIALCSTITGKDIVSKYLAGVSFRGGSPTMLHVSEWATVQFDNPARSEEIKTGAMEAARRGIRCLESSWKGGKGGHVWGYVELALESDEADKSPEDWRLRFFPWWVDKRNVRDGSEAAYARIDAETHRYLDEKEAELSILFSKPQRLWYYNAKRELGIFIKRENPTTLEECWSAPVEGAIYADLIERLRVERKILPIEKDDGLTVSTVWDLGSPSNTVVTYVQCLGGGKFDIIDCDGGLNLTTEERMEHMQKKGYVFDAHYVPHDAAADQRGGLSFQEELLRAGLTNVRVVPRTSDVEIGINAVRRMLPNCRINTRNCGKLIDALGAYHAKIESGQTHRSENIVHDWSSHYCDSVRVLAEAESHGMLSGQGGRRFDVQGVKALDVKAGLSDVKTGVVIVQERGVMFRECPVEESWLALSGRPQMGRFHVLCYAALHMRHVWAVLRVDFNELDYEASGIVMLAASLGDGVMDPDIAAQRVAATSQFFGSCLIVPVADDPEGTWRSLIAHGADRVLKRPKSVITKSAHQIGWAGNEDMGEPLAALAKRVREEQLECFHQPARVQLGQFMRQPGGKTGAMSGYSDEWVRALAVGCQCAGMATPFHPNENRRMRQEGAGIGAWMTPSKMSSL